jgi:16S rRNA (guanine527-N7)-methyltransferase
MNDRQVGEGGEVMEDAEDRAAALDLIPVSRETRERLDILAGELRRWQQVKNLVGPGTLDRIWTRHIADSLQLLDLAPTARTWVDLGSGAGFPGLVLGIAGCERDGMHVDLVESNGRKCAFLRHVVRLTGAAAAVHEARVEALIDRLTGVEVVTARALAPLGHLLAWAEPLLRTGTLGLFPKGREAQAELTEAAKSWRFDADLLPSRTDSEGRIVRIHGLKARGSL